MRLQALLLVCGVTALLSGVAFFGASLGGGIDVWLKWLFIVSTLLALIFLLLMLVNYARRSIESSVKDHDTKRH
jgi:hypothetical protein